MGFSNERMRTGQLVNWFLLDGLELTPAGYPVTQALSLPFGVDHLIGFNELLTCKHPENAGVHFFLDDYQFERFWRMPERYLYALEKCPLVIGPDFSLYTDFPAPIQHWNHYRNQLLTAWLQHNGVCTIPTASWSDEDSFRWCFDGISKGGAVAVSTVGCLVHKDALQGLLRGVAELIRQTEPEELLVYHGGFLSPQKKRLVTLIAHAASETMKIRFWADIDTGGFRMFRHLQELIPSLTPMRMSGKFVDSFHEHGLARSEAYLSSLRIDVENGKYPLFRDAIERILNYGVTIEQETFLNE